MTQREFEDTIRLQNECRRKMQSMLNEIDLEIAATKSLGESVGLTAPELIYSMECFDPASSDRCMTEGDCEAQDSPWGDN